MQINKINYSNMEQVEKHEVYVSNRNSKWEVFFPMFPEALFSTDTIEGAKQWADQLAGESGYNVIVQS